MGKKINKRITKEKEVDCSVKLDLPKICFFNDNNQNCLNNINRKNVILIDEPGNSLHGKAQEDVLKIFEKICLNLIDNPLSCKKLSKFI